MATIVFSKYFGQVVTNNVWLYSYKCGPKETLSLPDPQYCCYCFIFLCRLPCCCLSISWPRRSPSLIPGTLSWLWLRTTPWAMPFKSTPSTDAKSRECCPPITTQIIYWSKMIVHFVVPPSGACWGNSWFLFQKVMRRPRAAPLCRGRYCQTLPVLIYSPQ